MTLYSSVFDLKLKDLKVRCLDLSDLKLMGNTGFVFHIAGDYMCNKLIDMPGKLLKERGLTYKITKLGKGKILSIPLSHTSVYLEKEGKTDYHIHMSASSKYVVEPRSLRLPQSGFGEYWFVTAGDMHWKWEEDK